MKKFDFGKMIPIYLVVFMICIVSAIFGSRAVTVLSEYTVVPNRTCIIIDAGHGGVDGGATSCTGILESNLNLAIAKKLNDLMKIIGYDTKMIRDKDISVYTEGESIAAKKVSDLKNRVKTVNDTTNSLLISIHQNYFNQNQYKGSQVFYSDNGQDRELAEMLQRTFNQSINIGSNRKIKSAKGIYLMDNIQSPGVLIECGFLSNPQEEALLRDSDYQKKICCIIASSVSLFLDR